MTVLPVLTLISNSGLNSSELHTGQLNSAPGYRYVSTERYQGEYRTDFQGLSCQTGERPGQCDVNHSPGKRAAAAPVAKVSGRCKPICRPLSEEQTQHPAPVCWVEQRWVACLCVCYSMWAARSGITMESIEVDIIADYNDAAFLGTVDAPPGYTGVQYRVTVCSDAAESDILRVLDLADKHSPYLDVFSRDQQCVRQVVIKNPTEKDRS